MKCLARPAPRNLGGRNALEQLTAGHPRVDSRSPPLQSRGAMDLGRTPSQHPRPLHTAPDPESRDGIDWSVWPWQLFYFHGITPIGLDRILAEGRGLQDDLLQALREQGRSGRRHDPDARCVADECMGPRRGDLGRRKVLALSSSECSTSWTWSSTSRASVGASSSTPRPSSPTHTIRSTRAGGRRAQAGQRPVVPCTLAVRGRRPRSRCAFVDAYTMLFEGALVVRQVHDRDDAVRAAKPHVQRLIDEFVPSAET